MMTCTNTNTAIGSNLHSNNVMSPICNCLFVLTKKVPQVVTEDPGYQMRLKEKLSCKKFSSNKRKYRIESYT